MTDYRNADVLASPSGLDADEQLVATKCDNAKVAKVREMAEARGWRITRIVEMDGDLSAFGEAGLNV